MDTGNTPIWEKLDMLGAALMTASVGHGLLCLATLPGLIEAPYSGVLGGAVKVLGIVWTIAGVVAAGYVAVQALSIFKGKNYEKAYRAAIGTLALPFIGLTGGVTAFALVPFGAAAWWLLRQPSWQAGFAPVDVENEPEPEIPPIEEELRLNEIAAPEMREEEREAVLH